MTVAELIEALKTLDPDLPVYKEYWEDDSNFGEYVYDKVTFLSVEKMSRPKGWSTFEIFDAVHLH